MFEAEFVMQGPSGSFPKPMPTISERRLLVPLPDGRSSLQEVWRIRMIRERERNQKHLLHLIDKETRRKELRLQKQNKKESEPQKRDEVRRASSAKGGGSQVRPEYSPKVILPMPKDRHSYQDALRVRLAKEKERRQEKLLRLIEKEERKKKARKKMNVIEVSPSTRQNAEEKKRIKKSDVSAKPQTFVYPSSVPKSLTFSCSCFAPDPPTVPSRSQQRCCRPRMKRRVWVRMRTSPAALPASNESDSVKIALLGSTAFVRLPDGTQMPLPGVSPKPPKSENKMQNRPQLVQYTNPVEWFDVQKSPVRYQSKENNEENFPLQKKTMSEQVHKISHSFKKSKPVLDMQTFIDNVAKYKMN